MFITRYRHDLALAAQRDQINATLGHYETALPAALARAEAAESQRDDARSDAKHWRELAKEAVSRLCEAVEKASPPLDPDRPRSVNEADRAFAAKEAERRLAESRAARVRG